MTSSYEGRGKKEAINTRKLMACRRHLGCRTSRQVTRLRAGATTGTRATRATAEAFRRRKSDSTEVAGRRSDIPHTRRPETRAGRLWYHTAGASPPTMEADATTFAPICIIDNFYKPINDSRSFPHDRFVVIRGATTKTSALINRLRIMPRAVKHRDTQTRLDEIFLQSCVSLSLWSKP